VEWLERESLTTMTVLFGSMVFLVWFLPGLVNKSGKFPEDRPIRR
jgi:hypothetical protein